MIQQLVYISTMRRPMIEVEFEEILRVSRHNNARDDITGVLIVGRNRFLQLLEGPPEAVVRTYARIRADKRHYAAVVVDGREADARACPDWTMGYRVGGDAPDEGSLSEMVARMVAPISDPSLRAQFIGFGEIQGQAA